MGIAVCQHKKSVSADIVDILVNISSSSTDNYFMPQSLWIERNKKQCINVDRVMRKMTVNYGYPFQLKSTSKCVPELFTRIRNVDWKKTRTLSQDISNGSERTRSLIRETLTFQIPNSNFKCFSFSFALLQLEDYVNHQEGKKKIWFPSDDPIILLSREVVKIKGVWYRFYFFAI